MNIALIIPMISGGGAERASQTIGDYYNQKGFSVFYFLFDKRSKLAYPLHGEVVRLGIDLDISGVKEFIHSIAILREAKKKYKIDVAISFMEISNYLNVCSKNNEKVIISVRTVLSKRTDYSGTIYDPRWISIFYNMADKVVAVSNYVKQDLVVNYGVRKKRIMVIPNFPHHQSLKSQELEWKYGNDSIICVGRLDPVKQQDRIIRAFSYVKRYYSKAELVILGQGKLEKYLKRLCNELNVDDSVHFIGFTASPEFYLKNSKVFVMASLAEGFPNAMVEAMAYGVPIVTTDSPGGCGEIIGKKNNNSYCCSYGILTPYIKGRAPRDKTLEKEETVLGESLLSILTDDALYEYYSSKSLTRAKYYSKERVMSCWNRLLDIDF